MAPREPRRPSAAERLAMAVSRFTGKGAAFVLKSHSIEEAQARHESKLRPGGGPHPAQRAQQGQEKHRSKEPHKPAGR